MGLGSWLLPAQVRRRRSEWSARLLLTERSDGALWALSRQPARSSRAVIQPEGRNCKPSESSGLAVPAAATFRTWV